MRESTQVDPKEVATLDQLDQEGAEEQARMMELYTERVKDYEDRFLHKGKNPTAEEYQQASEFIGELIKNAENETTAKKMAYALGQLAFAPPAVLSLILVHFLSIGTGDLVSNLVLKKFKEIRLRLMSASQKLDLLKGGVNATGK